MIVVSTDNRRPLSITAGKLQRCHLQFIFEFYVLPSKRGKKIKLNTFSVRLTREKKGDAKLSSNPRVLVVPLIHH